MLLSSEGENDNMELIEQRLQVKEQEIQQLKAEIAANQKRNTAVAIREVKVLPPDYEENKATIRRLEKKISKYQKIFELGNMSELGILIDKYVEDSKKQLRKIAMEIKSTSYERYQIIQIINLIDFMAKIRDELYSFIITTEEGKFLINPAYRKVSFDINVITDTLKEKKKIINLDEDKLEELHQLLRTTNNNLNEFFALTENVNKKTPE